jgi:hypothetical protein
MAGRPVFVFVGAYDSKEGAEADYEVVKELHKAGAVGGFDAAVITKDEQSKVNKPHQEGEHDRVRDHGQPLDEPEPAFEGRPENRGGSSDVVHAQRCVLASARNTGKRSSEGSAELFIAAAIVSFWRVSRPT